MIPALFLIFLTLLCLLLGNSILGLAGMAKVTRSNRDSSFTRHRR